MWSTAFVMNAALPTVIRTCNELRTAIRSIRAAGRTIGVTPTMGALHEGHLSLVKAASAACDVVVATIFVNPSQFGPGEDLQQYPRTLQADLEKLATLNTSLVFAPADGEMYPAEFSTYVEPPALAMPLEGGLRPGHFRGVATIVLKLLNLVQPDVAFFGQKDFQQAAVIKAMVRDLNVPVRIEIMPTIREPDGLAMSSRNAYLSRSGRQRALALHRSLQAAQSLVTAGETSRAVILQRMHQEFESEDIREIDYIELADPATLQPVDTIQPPVVALLAARIGGTRLIDNQILM